MSKIIIIIIMSVVVVVVVIVCGEIVMIIERVLSRKG